MKTLKLMKHLNSYKKRFYSTQNLDKKIVVEKLGTITTIGINRPEKRNSLDSQTLVQLSNEVEAFENDKSAYVAVLYGIGGNFCSGYDLNEIAVSKENAESFFKTISNVNLTRRFIRKPLVAAISGYAVGSGMELALMCDLRVMEDTAVLGFLNRRFGIPTLDGGTVRLSSMVGLPYALDLLLTGRGVTGKEALERGLTTRLVACGTSLGQAINLASSVNKYSQLSLNTDRKSMYYSIFEAKSLDDAMNFEKINSISDDIISESVDGARRFLSGVGKHGKFYNIIEKEKKAWENEE